jgi:alanyl-tRNA synthetase
VRAEAQSFTASPRAVYVAASRDPAAILLAVSADAGLQAGTVLKQALADAGGRGGGSPAWHRAACRARKRSMRRWPPSVV